MQKVHLTPADLVTGSRFLLTGAVAAAALHDGPRWLLGVLAGTALLSDLVDGRLARATGTTSPRGARLDQEADAVLILVLSAVVAADLGGWVLGIGLARYAFGAVFALVPTLRTAPAAPRPWCRTVAATTGVVLAAVAAVPLPGPVATAALAVVAVLLAESFLHEGVDRWRSPAAPLVLPYPTILAGMVVWLALVAPTDRDQLSAHALLRLPLEGLLVIALALVPRRRLRAGLAGLAGALLAVLVLIKALDLGFETVFDRGFDPLGDWGYLAPGIGVLGDSIGLGWARVVTALAGVAVLAVVALVTLAMVRLVGTASEHRRTSLTGALVFATVWMLCLATGVEVGNGAPIASTSAASLTVAEVKLVRADIADSSTFAREIRHDPYADRAVADARTLLTGLSGKDVLVVFFESYGRVALQGTSYSPAIDQLVDQSTQRLDAAGYHSRSAFLTSPTFGGGSWLAHSTLESGLWVDSERRYGQLLDAHRSTLTSLFGKAGWRTVFDVPADTEDWPAGRRYYGFEQYYDSTNVGYQGPKLGYAPIPDQYTLEQFRRNELAPTGRKPVMAEIDLVSSHAPWTPLPPMLAWDTLGDGSVYAGATGTGPNGTGPTAATVTASSDTVKQRYGDSVQYTWKALTSFLTTYDDPDLVVLVLGDHQPHTYVSGSSPGHDVPVSVIAQDPDVIARIAGWGWQDGLHPSPDATVWRMDTFRDKFLAAFDGPARR